ncbi:MAG: energy transducer TonB [Reichenbachiella sp.]
MFFYIGLAVSLLLVITAFEWKFVDDGLVTALEMENANFEEFQDIPQTEQPPPPPPQKLLQQPKIIEVPDEEILEDIVVEMDVEVSEEMVVADVEFIEEEPEEEVAEEIFLIVEDKPEPTGGLASFYKYVGENIKYPVVASRNGVQGRVFVQFVVNSKGEIREVVAVKGIGAGCDEEAVRIIKNAPDWNPGRQRGRPVSVRMILPITFKLAN